MSRLKSCLLKFVFAVVVETCCDTVEYGDVIFAICCLVVYSLSTHVVKSSTSSNGMVVVVITSVTLIGGSSFPEPDPSPEPDPENSPDEYSDGVVVFVICCRVVYSLSTHVVKSSSNSNGMVDVVVTIHF